MLVDYQTLVTELVRDDAARIVAAERDRAITAAVLRYSADKPQTKVQDLTPESSQVLPLPAAWEAGFSVLLELEHPIGDTPPTLLRQDRYGLYQEPAATKIKLLDGVTVAAGSVRSSFTIMHVVSGVADTIPLHHREPVACYAAASLCDQLAGFYSGSTESTIQADSADGRTRAQEYAARAKALRKRYFDELGIEDKHGMAAGVVVNLDLADSQGQERLTHAARFR
jgi:hypothetical protein